MAFSECVYSFCQTFVMLEPVVHSKVFFGKQQTNNRVKLKAKQVCFVLCSKPTQTIGTIKDDRGIFRLWGLASSFTAAPL